MGLGDDEIVDIEIVVVFRVGDGALERLADVEGDALARELEIGQRRLDPLAADQLRQQVELLRADAKHATDGFRLRLLELALCLRLGHQPLFAFLSAAWPWNVRVGENSPSLWPIMSSVTVTGMCLWPL